MNHTILTRKAASTIQRAFKFFIAKKKLKLAEHEQKVVG
jgi:hypothetical protein